MQEPLTLDQRLSEMADIALRVKTCTLCDLYKGRNQAVPGDGPVTAEIMFIGEGPGFNEDQKGLPFIGQSGKFLDEMLALIGLDRKKVFISNVVKCRPPENRDPLPNEVSTCTKTYLFRQIELINPKIIVTLGRFSMGLFFPNAKITQIHGQPKRENGRIYLPMFHPAAVLRSMATLRPQAEADMRKLLVLLAEYDQAPPPAATVSPTSVTPTSTNPAGNSTVPPDEPPQQLTLF